MSNYYNDNDTDDANDESKKTSSRTSDKYFFGKSSTKEIITTEGYKKEKENENENEKGKEKITIHLNKRIERGEYYSDNNISNNLSSTKLWNDSYAASAKKDATYCENESIIVSSVGEQTHKEESSKYLSVKKKKSRCNDSPLDVNNYLNYGNYLSDNSCSSKNITKSSLQLDGNNVVDHLYKSDSFVETYQKSYKNKNSEPIIYDYADSYCNEQDGESEGYDLSKGVNIYTEGRRKKKILASKPPTTKSLTINIETMQRKSDGHIKRHAYYNRNVNKEDSCEEEKKSEHIIKTRMNKYEHTLNAREKLEVDKYKDMTRKLKREREERERKREEERQKEDESVLNISHYIQSDEIEQKNSDNNFGFFNMIQAYTKDNNWFDVSTINKYYQFNKSNMDYELDDINYNQNTKQRKNDKREEDDDIPF